jgi:hypothetical protein
VAGPAERSLSGDWPDHETRTTDGAPGRCSRRSDGRRRVQYCSVYDILIDDEPARPATFGRANRRGLGAVWAITQGLVTLVAPHWSVEVTKRLLETNSENADELEPKPAYGRWHDPCPDAAKSASGGIPQLPRGRWGCTVQGDTASVGTPNTPHPSRDSRTAHEPRHPVQAGGFVPVGRTGVPRTALRGAMASPTPSANGEPSPFTVRRMS